MYNCSGGINNVGKCPKQTSKHYVSFRYRKLSTMSKTIILHIQQYIPIIYLLYVEYGWYCLLFPLLSTNILGLNPYNDNNCIYTYIIMYRIRYIFEFLLHHKCKGLIDFWPFLSEIKSSFFILMILI